jgi:hypothetical protein
MRHHSMTGWTRTVYVFAALGIVLNALPGYAAYVLEAGQGNDLCELYTANLNTDNPKVPYATNRPISASFPDFHPTTWSYVPEGAPFPGDAVIEFFWQRDANPAWYLIYPDEWQQWQGTTTDIRKAKRTYKRQLGDSSGGFAQFVSFRVARADIDNDGALDNVVKFSLSGSSLLLVLNEDLAKIDHKKSNLVLRHPVWGNKSADPFRQRVSPQQQPSPTFSKRELDAVEDAIHGASYGVFTFRENTYYDLWWLNNPQSARFARPPITDWRLRVFAATGSHALEVCKMRFDFQ